MTEQDEISGLETIGWEKHSWKYMSLIGDERIINLQRTKVYVFLGFCVVDDVMGQSVVLSAIKTEVLLDSDDPAYQNFLLQQYGERFEKLSEQDKLSKFCMDAGFQNVVLKMDSIS